MKATIDAELLRHGVGRAIFCRGSRCESLVMDCARAVQISAYHNGELATVQTVCAACWDGYVLENTRKIIDHAAAKGLDISVSAIDGRLIDWKCPGLSTGYESAVKGAESDA